MVDSVVLVVLKSTALWLCNKGRDRAVKKLRHSGDVVDQNLCSLIASDLDEIKSEMLAAKRTSLLTSIDLYNEGLRSISFDAQMDGPPLKKMKMDGDPLSARSAVETFYKADVSLSPTTKERFADARRKAVEALGNQKLEIMDTILAYYIKVMATLLEDADTDPARALLFCKDYLEKLNSMKKVTKNFAVEIGSSLWTRASLGYTERRNIIWSVCHVNRIVFDMAQLVGGDRVFRELFIWPCIEIEKKEKEEKEEIDPLRDFRLIEPLRKEGKAHCSVIQSFGHEGHKLTLPCGIATNPQGQFVVVDDTKTDVFDSFGKYLFPLYLPSDDTIQYSAVDVDTDCDSNAYLLVAKRPKQDHEQINKLCYELFVFDNNGNLHRSFPLRSNSKGRRVAVNRHDDKNEVLVLEGESGLHAMVEVYGTDGTFVCQFGERILQDAQDIVSANNGHSYVLDKCHEFEKKFLYEFGADRQQLHKFDVAPDSVAIAFHRASEGIVLISTSNPKSFILSVYCKLPMAATIMIACSDYYAHSSSISMMASFCGSYTLR